MPTIIISYRRSDLKWITGRIVDRLERDYGKDDVFVDIDAIPPGMDFREHLRNVLDRCDILLAIIGPNWLAVDASGRPRIFDPTDWVRVEIETALTNNIPVVPVLIDRTPMPQLSELPESMHSFAFRQAADVDTGRDFHSHMDRLVRAISKGSIARSSASIRADRAIGDRSTRVSSVYPENHHRIQAPPQRDMDVRTLQRPPLGDDARIGPSGQQHLHVRYRGFLAAIGAVASTIVIAIFLAQIWWAAPAPTPGAALPDELEQAGGATSRPPQTMTDATATRPAPVLVPSAAIPQKAILYEEDPDDSQGRRFSGSAIWRIERVSAGPSKPEEVAIRADVDVPERRLTMTLSLRRNTDKAVPASHTVDIMFRVPRDFLYGSITSVPGILAKPSENSRGSPLAGHAIKMTDNYYVIGLSSVDADRENNLRMLKERGWFDIPVVYSNKRRAILAVEKGTPGDRAFAEAFAAWRQ